MDISASIQAISSYNGALSPSSLRPDTSVDVQPAGKPQPEKSEHDDKNTAISKSGQQLSESDERETRELQRRDQEVKAHEAAHKAAAGSYATGGASFDYQRGPDGRQYAIGGEVSIDTSRPENPREAQSKAQTIQAAALAPAEPSAQDRQVAQAASQMAAEARAELVKQATEKEEPAAQYAAIDRAGGANQTDNESGELINELV